MVGFGYFALGFIIGAIAAVIFSSSIGRLGHDHCEEGPDEQSV